MFSKALELESPPLNEPLHTAILVAFGSTYVTYFDILTISNCRLGSRGSCSSGMSYPDGRCGHSPTRRAEASFSFALKGVFSAFNLTIRTSTLSDTHPHQSPPPCLCMSTHRHHPTISAPSKMSPRMYRMHSARRTCGSCGFFSVGALCRRDGWAGTQ